MPPVPAPGTTGLALPPRPAGDPDALRAVRDALIGPVTGLIVFGIQVDGLARVPGWEGPAATAFAARSQEVAQRLRAASNALAETEQALASLASSLREAGDLWDGARALWREGAQVGGIFAQAEQESSSAYRLATQQLDDAAHRLATLTHQSRSPLPKAMAFPINPCGLVPEEAAGAFWNQGMMPLDTECLALAEVTIYLDDVPVETFEAVPIGADTNERKPKAGSGEPVQSPEDKIRIRDRISRQLATGSQGERFEPETARHLLSENIQILRFRSPITTSDGRPGEIDIETPEVIIEATLRPQGKLDQVLKYKDRLVNPGNKPVIVYSAGYTDQAEIALAKQGISVARTLTQLLDMIDAARG